MKEHFVKIKKLIWDDKDVKAFTLFGLALIILLPLIFKFPLGNCISYFDYTQTGAIGDTIGGITGPFINLLGAILVYLAFKEQVKANENQDKINSRQEDINRKNEAEKESNNIEDQISKLELYILEDKFKLLEIANKFKKYDFKKKGQFEPDVRELARVTYVQSIYYSILDELSYSKENNEKYNSQKIKMTYLKTLIDSSGYIDIIIQLETYKRLKYQTKTEAIEHAILKKNKNIDNKLNLL